MESVWWLCHLQFRIISRRDNRHATATEIKHNLGFNNTDFTCYFIFLRSIKDPPSFLFIFLQKQQPVHTWTATHLNSLRLLRTSCWVARTEPSCCWLAESTWETKTKELADSWTAWRVEKAALFACALQMHLSWRGACCLLHHLVGDDRNVSPLLIQDHGELPVQLFDLQVDLVLAFKHLTDLPITGGLIQVLNLRQRQLESRSNLQNIQVCSC